jgi:glycosyltransferase 2 family protein
VEPEATGGGGRSTVNGRHIRWAALAGLVGGVALMTLLVVHFGAAEVGRAIGTAGWTGVAAISGFHLLLEAAMGLAWWLLVRRQRRGARPWVFMWGRWLRDAGSDILPLSQVGGYVLGVRAVMLHGVDATLGAASTIVDLTLELGGQIVYTTLGVALLLRAYPHSRFDLPALIGLAIAVLAAAGFVMAQRRRVPIIDRLAAQFGHRWLAAVAASTETVQADIRAIYRDWPGVTGSFLLHLATWLASAVEALIVLRLMGSTLGILPILAIESLLYAARSAAFLVPNALGVQEGAYVLLGAAFGLPPDMALALSLLKRARDLVLGIPALLLWQFVEGRRLWVRRGRAPVRAGGERGAPP